MNEESKETGSPAPDEPEVASSEQLPNPDEPFAETEAAGDTTDAETPEHWAERVRKFIDDAARVAREELGDREVTFEETIERAEHVVRKHPLAAVGVAAGIGFLAGILVNRRS